MKKRNIIIAIIIVIIVVIGSIAIWYNTSNKSKLTNEVKENVVGLKTDLDNQVDMMRINIVLLKAKLATESENTYDSAYKYLEEAKRWYRHNSYQASKTLDSTSQEMIKKINEAQKYLKERKDGAKDMVSDILLKASEFVKDDDQ